MQNGEWKIEIHAAACVQRATAHRAALSESEWKIEIHAAVYSYIIIDTFEKNFCGVKPFLMLNRLINESKQVRTLSERRTRL